MEGPERRTKELTPFQEKILDRESKFKLVLSVLVTFFVIGFLFVFIYCIIIGKITFNFTDLRFSDLLSLIMAIFAISLSIIFYHKATETSNIFYNNSYEFTNHVSELLGRIESGFEERLKQLDKGQSDLIGKFDRLPYLKESISEEDKKLQKEIEEKQKIVAELLSKTSLHEHEKEQIKNQLIEKDKSIDDYKKEIRRLSKQLDHFEGHISLKDRDQSLIREMRGYLYRELHEKLPKIEKSMSFEMFIDFFYSQMGQLHSGFIHDMKRYGLLNQDDKLTRSGLSFINYIYHELREG